MDISKLDQIKFYSISELGEHVEQLEATDGFRRGKSSNAGGIDPTFYGPLSLKKAASLASAGGEWREGADKMPSVHVPHETLDGRPLPVQQFESDIVGFAPSVPAYLSGVPDSMLDFVDTDSADKILRVAVHVGRSSTVTPAQIFNRGAAILAVLDQLAKDGYAVELWAIWRNNDARTGVSVETRVKASDELWSPESAAFALAHVGFQRRLCWRAAESLQGPNNGGKITNGGYGAGDKANFSDYDLSYKFVTPQIAGKLNNIDAAVDYIKTETLAQLAAK